MVGREDDDAVGGRDHERAGWHRDVGARMVRSLLTALVDALRPEIGRDAPRCRPDEALAPAVAIMIGRARGLDLRELGRTQPLEGGAGPGIFWQAAQP